MANSEQQTLGAVLCQLNDYKEKNRRLLQENTDLRIEIASLRVEKEMLECFLEGSNEHELNK